MADGRALSGMVKLGGKVKGPLQLRGIDRGGKAPKEKNPKEKGQNQNDPISVTRRYWKKAKKERKKTNKLTSKGANRSAVRGRS